MLVMDCCAERRRAGHGASERHGMVLMLGAPSSTFFDGSGSSILGGGERVAGGNHA